MKTFITYLLLTLIPFGASSCTYLTKNGRQQAAYAHYVRKMSMGRVRLQSKVASSPKFVPQMTEPTTSTATGPQSVTASNQSQ